MTTTSATVAAASICIPPWPGGVTRWGGPLGVRGAHPPPVDPRWPRELPPNVAICTREEADKLRHDRRHFHQLVLHRRRKRTRKDTQHGVRIGRHCHQLIHHLRLLERGTLQDRVLKNLGHFDDLLDVRQRLVEDLQHFHHRVHRLRRRNVEERDDGHNIDNLLHGAAAGLAPAARIRQTAGPAASPWRQAHHPRPSDSTRCLPPGEGDASGSSPQSSTRNPPLPGPGHLLSP